MKRLFHLTITLLIASILVLVGLWAALADSTAQITIPTSTPELIFATSTPRTTPTATPPPPQAIFTLTPASNMGAPAAYINPPAGLSAPEGWSCGDFPCVDDIDGWLQRIQVPPRYRVEPAGRFPGEVMQIAYGADNRLYATVLENGTRSGAVYAMNADGTTERVSATIESPLGLAFQPGTNNLYVTGRAAPTSGATIYRVLPGGLLFTVIENLPCCLSLIDNQANGLAFGHDGFLYVGVGSLTDHWEVPPGSLDRYAAPQPYEASILRINPATREIEVYAEGIRNPFDLAFDAAGELYATDNGMFTGEGDRVLHIERARHHGFPYWMERGCEECPFQPATLEVVPDLITLPTNTLPRGVTVYTGSQFPSNIFNSLFVALWNGTPDGQRIIRVEPRTVPPEAHLPELQFTLSPYDPTRTPLPYIPEAFVTGLIRPIDVIMSPDGALVVADYVYGLVWRVVYTG